MQKLFSTGKTTLTPDAPLIFKNDNGNLLAITFFTATGSSSVVPNIQGKRNGEEWDDNKSQKLPGVVLLPCYKGDTCIDFSGAAPGNTIDSPFIVMPPSCSISVKRNSTGYPVTVYYVGIEAFDEIRILIPSGTNNSVTLSVDLCIS